MTIPAVSIIMGSYNPTDLQGLHRAVESIIAQTYSDWEFIICDDGSDAPYVDRLRELSALDPRIRCIRTEQNCGLAHALNCCIAHSCGRWIARMDDDDFSEPERLEKQVGFLSAHSEYAWVGCQALLFDQDGIWGDSLRPEVPDQKDFLRYSPFIHPSVMFRREVLEQAHGYMETPLTARCEDYELFMRLAAMGYCGYNLRDKLLHYQESRSTLDKRQFRYCFNEAIIRWCGFRRMGLLSLRSSPYILKPLAVAVAALMPRLAQQIRIRYCPGVSTSRINIRKDLN